MEENYHEIFSQKLGKKAMNVRLKSEITSLLYAGAFVLLGVGSRYPENIFGTIVLLLAFACVISVWLIGRHKAEPWDECIEKNSKRAWSMTVLSTILIFALVDLIISGFNVNFRICSGDMLYVPAGIFIIYTLFLHHLETRQKI